MWLLFLLSTIGCIKKDMVKTARLAFTDNNCAKTLELYMRSAGCSDAEIVNRNVEIILRCKKPDAERHNIWDTYWFRFTPSDLKIDKSQIDEIEKHTICKDSMHRLEAYPPE